LTRNLNQVKAVSFREHIYKFFNMAYLFDCMEIQFSSPHVITLQEKEDFPRRELASNGLLRADEDNPLKSKFSRQTKVWLDLGELEIAGDKKNLSVVSTGQPDSFESGDSDPAFFTLMLLNYTSL
jgi:hypothetical protein